MKRNRIYTRSNYEGTMPYPLPVSIRSFGIKNFVRGERDENTELHSPFFEIIWCKQNVGDIILFEEKFTLAENDVFCYCPHEKHSLHALSENWEIYWLTFDGPLAASFWSSYGYPRKMHVSKPFPQALFDRIKQEIGSTDPEVFRNTLSLLCELFSLLGGGDSFPEAGLVPRALELIRDNLHNAELNVNFLAEQLNTHRSTLVAQFRKELNRTPSKAIRDRRIALAERLLRCTNLNVREISRRCGFPEESSFCRFFQTRNHMTPIQFRQQNSNRSADKEESADFES